MTIVKQEVEEEEGQVQVKLEDQGLDLGEFLKLEYSLEQEVEETGVNPVVNPEGCHRVGPGPSPGVTVGGRSRAKSSSRRESSGGSGSDGGARGEEGGARRRKRREVGGTEIILGPLLPQVLKQAFRLA